jgi:hypothetical protein
MTLQKNKKKYNWKDKRALKSISPQKMAKSGINIYRKVNATFSNFLRGYTFLSPIVSLYLINPIANS